MGHNDCNLNGLLSCTTFTFIDFKGFPTLFSQYKKRNLCYSQKGVKHDQLKFVK